MGVSKLNGEITEKRAETQLPNFLAQNIRLMRKRMGLSQHDLAEKVGLNRGNIASYESGTAEPKICKLLRISKLIGVNSHDMTRLDLSQDSALEQAMESYTAVEDSKTAMVEKRLQRVGEIDTVLQSVKNLYNFREQNLELGHPDVKALAHYYEQMQDIAQNLLKEHRRLLEELKCHCK